MVRNIEHRKNKKVQNKYCKSQITHIIKSAGIVSLIFMQFSLVNKLWVPQQKIEFTNKTGENHMHQHTKAAIHGAHASSLFDTWATDDDALMKKGLFMPGMYQIHTQRPVCPWTLCPGV